MKDVDLGELERYLRIYQENPDSRVFAPLADLYRRLGRLEEAEQICRDGIRRHPYYAGGRVALAHVLLELGSVEEALKESEAVVTYYPDNLLARKLLIRSLGMTRQLDRAKRELEALRFIAPMVAEDPELVQASQGLHIKSSIVSQRRAPTAPMVENPNDDVLQEKTEEIQTLRNSAASVAVEYYLPSKKELLIRKKRILENLIFSLSTT